MRPLFMFANTILSREYSKTLTYDFKFLLGSSKWHFDRLSLKWSLRSLPAVCFLSRCHGIFFRFASAYYHQVLCWNKRIIIEFYSETSKKNHGIVAATGRLSTGNPSRKPCSFASVWSHAALHSRERLNKAGVFSFSFSNVSFYSFFLTFSVCLLAHGTPCDKMLSMKDRAEVLYWQMAMHC